MFSCSIYCLKLRNETFSLTIGNSLCDAASSYIYGAISGANYLFNNITTGSINIGLYITSGSIYLGGGSHTGIIHIGANNSRIRIQNQDILN